MWEIKAGGVWLLTLEDLDLGNVAVPDPSSGIHGLESKRGTFPVKLLSQKHSGGGGETKPPGPWQRRQCH